MHLIVRQFDLSHLRIWLDGNGLWIEENTKYELEHGYGRYVRPGNRDVDRIKKYMQRGWMIFGDTRHLVPESYPPINLTMVSMKEAIEHLREPKISLVGYHGGGGIHLGHIEDIVQDDVKVLKLKYENTNTIRKNISPIRFYANPYSITPFNDQLSAFITVGDDINNRIKTIDTIVHEKVGIDIERLTSHNPYPENHIAKLTSSALETLKTLDMDRSFVIELEIHLVSSRVYLKHRMTRIIQ